MGSARSGGDKNSVCGLAQLADPRAFPRLWWKTSASNRDKPLFSAAWWETYANQVSVSRSTANSQPIQLRDHAWGKISKPVVVRPRH